MSEAQHLNMFAAPCHVKGGTTWSLRLVHLEGRTPNVAPPSQNNRSACPRQRIASFSPPISFSSVGKLFGLSLSAAVRRAKERPMNSTRKETDSLGVVEVPADKLWGAQTQRSLEHFSIGKDLIPREMITAYATLKKAAAIANRDGKRLDDQRYNLIVQTCDEILAGQHHDMFPLHVWMTGSGTQFNMNVNEVISNRCCQLAGTPLGSHAPVHS